MLQSSFEMIKLQKKKKSGLFPWSVKSFVSLFYFYELDNESSFRLFFLATPNPKHFKYFAGSTNYNYYYCCTRPWSCDRLERAFETFTERATTEYIKSVRYRCTSVLIRNEHVSRSIAQIYTRVAYSVCTVNSTKEWKKKSVRRLARKGDRKRVCK